MKLRFNGNRIAAAAVVGAVALGAIGCSSCSSSKTDGMMARVVQKCMPLIELQRKDAKFASCITDPQTRIRAWRTLDLNGQLWCFNNYPYPATCGVRPKVLETTIDGICNASHTGPNADLTCYSEYKTAGGTLSKETFSHVGQAIRTSVIAGASSDAITTEAISIHDEVTGSEEPSMPLYKKIMLCIGAAFSALGALGIRSAGRIYS